ncbi:uncharacterized protein METZ01_LOCUS23294 [marine metagenome]|uniref:Uncharacterized protein n=1 Tax=marine metagenome TaxID=408172 RepID=A0A381PU64_9ZZZZ
MVSKKLIRLVLDKPENNIHAHI